MSAETSGLGSSIFWQDNKTPWPSTFFFKSVCNPSNIQLPPGIPPCPIILLSDNSFHFGASTNIPGQSLSGPASCSRKEICCPAATASATYATNATTKYLAIASSECQLVTLVLLTLPDKAGGQWGGVCLAGWCYTYIIWTHPARTTAGGNHTLLPLKLASLQGI